MTANASYVSAASSLVIRDHAERGIEVLLVQRAAASRSFAGMWAFPGGKVDAADRHQADLLATALMPAARPGLTRELLPYGIAGWRELLEETGGDQSLCHDPVRLATMLAHTIYWAHWVAPRESPVPFNTRFFLLDANILPHVPAPDGREISALRWLRPAEAVGEFLAGRLAAAPPTAFNLMELLAAAATASHARQLLAQEQGRVIIRIQPRVDRSTTPPYTTLPWDPRFAALGTDMTSDPPLQIPGRYRDLPSRLQIVHGVFSHRK